MLTVIKLLQPGIIVAAFVIAGCQSAGTKPGRAGPATQAVQCTQCKVKYVKAPTGVKPNITQSGPTMKVMECPGCRTAAENFFATGKLERSCSICGGSMEMCEGH